MHPVGTDLLTASFRGHGYNAVSLTKEDQSTFQRGKSCLRGSECLPAATTLGSFLDYYNNYKEEEDQETSLFMPCASGPCRFGQYSTIHQMVLNRLQINTSLLSFNSENNYREISGSLRLLIMKSIIITDIIIKLGCRVRPYVAEPQKVDHILKEYTEILVQSLERKNSLKKVLRLLGNDLKSIKPNLTNSKPLVGIVGEIYVRSSPFSNDNLVNKIEQHGAEVWLSPFMEWFHYTAWLKSKKNNSIVEKFTDQVTGSIVLYIETGYYKIFNDFLKNRIEPTTEEIIELAEPYISSSIRGEAILTIGRTINFIREGAKLIVNVAPFSCMPGNISSTILRRISEDYSIPIISLYYDGFTNFDQQLKTYLNNLK
ncbi:MAG: hypothetical protein K0B81_09320, partial [Candidatus Cloacimonetes bacterium]|nr:hypothetical protein [Candidatus Cloacimonadota bacterium]